MVSSLSPISLVISGYPHRIQPVSPSLLILTFSSQLHRPRSASPSLVSGLEFAREGCIVFRLHYLRFIRGCQIRTLCAVQHVSKFNDGCIIATHAPDTLRMLGEQATHEETRILGYFNYVYSDIFLHRDKSLMPHNTSAWSAWNFLGTVDNKACLTYWLNVLQNIDNNGLPYLVTLNPPQTPENTMLKWTTGHPVPSVAASKASLELPQIQGKRGISGSVGHTRFIRRRRYDVHL